MSDWKRTTTEVKFEALRPEVVAAIEKHIEQYNLGTILADALMCVQTVSEKVKKGLFGGAETVYTGVIVTTRWLLWATSSSKTPITVLSAQLRDIVVQDYNKTSFAKMIPDSGIEVSGRFTDASDEVSIFIGLDEGIGGKFRELVIKAAQDTRK